MSSRAKVKRHNGRSVVRAVRAWTAAGQLESALAWIVHEATDVQRADIAARSIAITESVAAEYGLTDDMHLISMSDRITAALAVDASGADYGVPGETSAELDRTLTAINRDLSVRRAG